MWQDSSGELKGMIFLTDDFLYAGSQTFLDTVVNKITERYKLGSKGADFFKNIGLQVTNTDSEITVSQDLYIASFTEIPILLLKTLKVW